jgi:hypothetical protein
LNKSTCRSSALLALRSFYESARPERSSTFKAPSVKLDVSNPRHNRWPGSGSAAFDRPGGDHAARGRAPRPRLRRLRDCIAGACRRRPIASWFRPFARLPKQHASRSAGQGSGNDGASRPAPLRSLGRGASLPDSGRCRAAPARSGKARRSVSESRWRGMPSSSSVTGWHRMPCVASGGRKSGDNPRTRARLSGALIAR